MIKRIFNNYLLHLTSRKLYNVLSKNIFLERRFLASNENLSLSRNYFESLLFFYGRKRRWDDGSRRKKRRRERGINYNQTRLRRMAVIWMGRDETATDSICVAHAHASKGPATWSTGKGLREYPERAFFPADKSRPVEGRDPTWNPTRRPHSRVHTRGGRGGFRKGERWGRRNKNVLLLVRATRDPVPFESSQTCNLRELETRFQRHCAPLFYGAFRIFSPRFIKFRAEKLSDIFDRKLSKKFMTLPRFSFSLVTIMEPLNPIYRN